MDEPRDWQGIRRRYLRVADRTWAATLRALARPGGAALDRAGVQAAWGLAEPGARTWLAAVRQPPPGTRLAGWVGAEPRFVPAPLAAGGPLADALAQVTAACACSAPMLALGGGLDAALVLAAWRAAGRVLPEAITLRTDMPGYDESERAQDIARAFGVRLHRVRISAEDLVAALPEAIGHIEWPLYNLHPVARLLLARAAARLGARTLVTGDGADQALAGRPAADYLPLAAALTEGAGLALWSPFLAEPVIAAALARGPDPEKAALRTLARALGVPAWVVEARKVAQYAPALDLSPFIDRPALAALAEELALPLGLGSDRELVGWVTLALARRGLLREQDACAG